MIDNGSNLHFTTLALGCTFLATSETLPSKKYKPVTAKFEMYSFGFSVIEIGFPSELNF
jgi:hypothetical protein